MSVRDHAGIRYGRLVVLHRAGSDRWKQSLWRCACDCGAETTVRGRDLRDGATRSCGCFHREVSAVGASELGKANKTHGMTDSPEWRSWQAAVTRTHNPNCDSWRHYGGRGITMSPDWLGSGGFERFYAELGPRPDGHSLDRIDNDKGYEPGNCRWATAKQQINNRRTRRVAA